MKILVTGGAGFIGSHIVDGYVQAGHRVTILDNLSNGKIEQINPNAKFARVDIRDRAKVLRLFMTGRFDVVNHHAAQMDVRHSILDPQYDASVNVLGTLNLLEGCKTTKVKKFIFSSSGGTVYGECRRPAKEGDPEVPLSPYGITKLAGEKYIQAFSSLYGLKYTVFRYSNVFGPRQDPHGEAGVVAIFANRLLADKKPFIFGDGKQTRDFVYVGDVANANRKALSSGNNQIINIGTQTETSVNTLWDVLADIAGSDLKPIKKPLRPGELQRSVLNFQKAKRVLGWEPELSIKEALSLTFDYFRFKNRKGQ